MTKWEYLQVVKNEGSGWFFGNQEQPELKKLSLSELFTHLGEQGWELVSVEVGFGTWYYFKRPRPWEYLQAAWAGGENYLIVRGSHGMDSKFRNPYQLFKDLTVAGGIVCRCHGNGF